MQRRYDVFAVLLERGTECCGLTLLVKRDRADGQRTTALITAAAIPEDVECGMCTVGESSRVVRSRLQHLSGRRTDDCGPRVTQAGYPVLEACPIAGERKRRR